ncbi:cation diffusion facilitator family transporter [Pseudolysinimonas sp.]|jgi:cation diffusion facilitator family transporter|uniref:cation diffusion facilitator family transporter n=1 Tax=Pseudolysinimonas sp. TaxID=2680009 RepID=UPI00378518DC
MSTEGGTRAVVAALLANSGIAVAKFVAAGISGSASMLAEGVHSVADAGNQVLLLVGGRRAKKAADEEHPFGYGRERYVFAFVVAIILFSVGGMFSLYEGIHKLEAHEELNLPWIPLAVLAIAIALESFSLRTAVIEANKARGKDSLFAFIRHAKQPELPVILLEDIAALTGLAFAFVGVSLSLLTGDVIWDAIGTIAIGVLLIGVAVVLGIETKSLLVGEGATRADVAKIRAVFEGHKNVEAIIHMKTLYLGPDELMVAAKVAVAKTTKATEIAKAINEIEVSVREAVPLARVIYIEPDIYVAGSNTKTDAIIIPGHD